MSDRDTTIELPITGMTCASCVARNENALGKVQGVDKAAVNFATEKATVTFDPGAVSTGDLVAAVEGAGYGVVTAQETLPIIGMTCASCVSRVERALRTPARRAQGRRQPRHREGHRHVHPRPGELPGPGRGGARRRLRRRRAGARHRRGGRRGGGRRRGGGPRRRLPPPQAQGRRRLRAQRHHLRRHDAAGLVHVPARLAAQRLLPLGPGQHRAVLGRLAVLHDRLVGAASTARRR